MEKTEGMTTRKIARFTCGMLTAGMLTAAVLMPVQVHAAEKETKLQTETAEEAGKVTFSTDYPGVTVKPGGTSTFTLYITNTGSEEDTVSLSAEDLPAFAERGFDGGIVSNMRCHYYSDRKNALTDEAFQSFFADNPR